MRAVCVFGLWHLGCVTAACLAEAGMSVVGLDADPARIANLERGVPPIAEPGLAGLIKEQHAAGRLRFTTEPAVALKDVDIVWVTLDTPVSDADEADTDWVRQEIERIGLKLREDTLVVVSSQVPVGFTEALETAWHASGRSMRFAYSPENLRLGEALDRFRKPERIVVGLGRKADPTQLTELFEPFSSHIEWMTLASAEMTKHALNGFLATSIAFTNELARICERVGADARDVERGLRTEPRIGPRAYVTPGPAFAGGTLARDIRFLSSLAQDHGLQSPVMDAVWDSNQIHSNWPRDTLEQLLAGISSPRVALLGLTYKPGTDTLRRSSAIELARELLDMNIAVNAFDPAVSSLPPELTAVRLAANVAQAISGADAAIVATPWPEFDQLQADQLVAKMRRAVLVDPFGLLAHLGADDRIIYRRVGTATSRMLPSA